MPYFSAIAPNFASVLITSFPINSGLASEIRPRGVYATGTISLPLQKLTNLCWVNVGFICKKIIVKLDFVDYSSQFNYIKCLGYSEINNFGILI